MQGLMQGRRSEVGDLQHGILESVPASTPGISHDCPMNGHFDRPSFHALFGPVSLSSFTRVCTDVSDDISASALEPTWPLHRPFPLKDVRCSSGLHLKRKRLASGIGSTSHQSTMVLPVRPHPDLPVVEHIFPFSSILYLSCLRG